MKVTHTLWSSKKGVGFVSLNPQRVLSKFLLGSYGIVKIGIFVFILVTYLFLNTKCFSGTLEDHKQAEHDSFSLIQTANLVNANILTIKLISDFKTCLEVDGSIHQIACYLKNLSISNKYT
ncbi:MAG: hypothetical protein EHM20_05055 [Alphaproteobacteria bacterium]|nr:MAG: hypothetical protein EHM20_05055 [Alphaproteobacteria bacterium]